MIDFLINLTFPQLLFIIFILTISIVPVLALKWYVEWLE